MADDPIPTAIARVKPVTVTMAKDLRTRQARELVYIDRRGQGQSPARAWAPIIAYLAAVGGLVAVGWMPWPVLVVVTLLMGWQVPQIHRNKRGGALLLHGRLDEAEAVLAPLARSRFSHPACQVMAMGSLARVHARRGDHAQALVWFRKAGRRRWPRVVVELQRYGEIVTLVNLGDLAEARALFTRRHARVPAGDLLRQSHWEAELYLALAEGHHAIAADELHRRALWALGLTAGRELLALLSWAHHHAGDVDQAWHLLREALAREDASILPRSMPRLHAWIEAHREAAVAADPDAAEDL